MIKCAYMLTWRLMALGFLFFTLTFSWWYNFQWNGAPRNAGTFISGAPAHNPPDLTYDTTNWVIVGTGQLPADRTDTSPVIDEEQVPYFPDEEPQSVDFSVNSPVPEPIQEIFG